MSKKAIGEIDLSEAYRKYAISNTPIFLIKMLRAEPATLEISANFTGEEISAALRSAVATEPREAIDFVRPYVYMVALSQLSEVCFLEEAVRLSGIEKWDWLPFVGGVLMETYSPIQKQDLPLQDVLLAPSLRGSESPVEFETINLQLTP